MNCLLLLLLLGCCGGNNGRNDDCCDRPMPRNTGNCCEEERDRDCCNVSGPDRRSAMSPPPRKEFPGYGMGETCGCEEKGE